MKLVFGDITKVSADAVVNAANTKLQHGGGVAAAIVAAGGKVIQDESNQIGWCDIGKAAVTGAGNLPAKCVIHVPTIDDSSGKKANLEDIQKGCAAAFEIARNAGCKSISFPLLGTGVVGLEAVEVAKASKQTANKFPEIDSTLVVRSQGEYSSLKDLF